MISKDPKLGVLRPKLESKLINVDKPNLFRDIFPYSEIPKLTFDGKIVPMEPAEDIFITDTTFRDGQQARPPYDVKHIVKIYDLLSKLGGPNGVIRASEFFLYSEKDREAVRRRRR
ncbi:MAG: histone-lysine N-methyltransferase, partial [Armatimonadota bacterium]